MLADTVQLGANLFYNDHRNQQIAVDNPEFQGYTYTANAAASFSCGDEIEGRSKPIDFLSFFRAVGVMRTEFTQGIINGLDVTGKAFPEAPPCHRCRVKRGRKIRALFPFDIPRP